MRGASDLEIDTGSAAPGIRQDLATGDFLDQPVIQQLGCDGRDGGPADSGQVGEFDARNLARPADLVQEPPASVFSFYLKS